MPTANPWLQPPSDLALPANEVHIWRSDLPELDDHVDTLKLLLTSDEAAKAARYLFETDRKRYILARSVLRKIISRYLPENPSNLRFVYGPQGKPHVVAYQNPNILTFNLAHSHRLALFAVTCHRDIGVDIERVRYDLDFDEISRRFFSSYENAILSSQGFDRRPYAFFATWVRKEAYLKARGDGLAFPLSQFDVSVVPEEPAKLLEVRGFPDEANNWTLIDIPVASEYWAALAVWGHNWTLRCWRFSIQW